MRGYVGVTYRDWYTYLASRPRVDEVNFWRPHGDRGFRALNPGDLFFFKLRGSEKAIVGFGFFEKWDSLPAWLAWECFGEMNGAPDFETLVDNILRVRGEGDSGDRTGNFTRGRGASSSRADGPASRRGDDRRSSVPAPGAPA